MTIGKREFDTGNKCYIMGILNVTPDSFSDGGMWTSLDNALRHAEQMVEEGVDIIDVGGESTRPGYTMISDQEEIDRTAPVIESLCGHFDIPVSTDTYKSAVAESAIRAGAHMVNDIWGLKHDPNMASLISRTGAVCCLMHNRDNMEYSDFMSDMINDLTVSTVLAKEAGISADKVILDPGIGFAKTHQMNLEAINRLDMIKKLGYPVLLGASRKSVVGLTLDLPVTERLEGSLAVAVIGIIRGCSFLRVHDVKETRRVLKMTEAILRSEDRGVAYG